MANLSFSFTFKDSVFCLCCTVKGTTTVGSVKTIEQKKEQYHDIISYLKRGYSIRNVAKLTGKGISTVQRIKAEFNL